MSGKKIRVHAAVNAFEAQIVKSALEQVGIAVLLKNEMLSALAGALPLNDVMTEVWIAEDDSTKAAEILTPLFEKTGGELSLRDGAIGGELSIGDDAPVDRMCPACGEPSPPHFTECWSCQASFD